MIIIIKMIMITMMIMLIIHDDPSPPDVWTGGHHDLCDFKDHGCDDDHYYLDIHDLVDHVYNDDHDYINDHGFVYVMMTIVTISLQAIADHGLVRKLGFTGSTEIGHTIMRLCHHHYY